MDLISIGLLIPAYVGLGAISWYVVKKLPQKSTSDDVPWLQTMPQEIKDELGIKSTNNTPHLVSPLTPKIGELYYVRAKVLQIWIDGDLKIRYIDRMGKGFEDYYSLAPERVIKLKKGDIKKGDIVLVSGMCTKILNNGTVNLTAWDRNFTYHRQHLINIGDVNAFT